MKKIQTHIHLNNKPKRKNKSNAKSNSNDLISGNEAIRQQLLEEDMIGDAGDKIENTVNDENTGEEVEIADQEQKTDKQEPELLHDIPQNEQSVFNCIDYETAEDSNYQFKFGDLQKWRIFDDDSNNHKFEDLWFLKDSCNKKQRRKVFVEGKVHRLFNINANDETFEGKLHLFLSWIITKDEYLLLKESENNDNESSHDEEFDYQTLWRPCLFIPNLIGGNIEFIESSGSKFKIVSYKKFGGFNSGPNMTQLLNENVSNNKNIESNGYNKFEIKNAQFVRCKVEISGIFHCDYKLQNFPFDIQDLNIRIMDRSGQSSFLPAFRERKYFMNVDSKCFECKEWDLEGTLFEFCDANPMYDSSSFGKPLSQFIIRFKYKRNYYMYLTKYVAIIASITALSLLVFSFSFNSVADRLPYIMGLILTVAFCDYQKPNTDYTTILDQYVLANYLFLILLMVIIGIAPHLIEDEEHHKKTNWQFAICTILFYLAYHSCFICYAMIKHSEEYKKLKLNYKQEIQQMIDEDDEMLVKMRADYTKPLYKNKELDSLTFLAKKQN